jgi:NADH dehydrogenase FAD-containing subunit
MRPAEHRVVIVGAGFGGLFAAKALRSAPASVTLINGTTYHLFEPLLYQVAAGILSEGEVAPPIREILRHPNLDVRLGWVTDVDAAGRTVLVRAPDGRERRVPYDSLIVAAGARNSYFGNERFAEHAPSLATRVVDVDAGGVELEGGDRVEAHTKIWAAGVSAAPLARRIAEATGAETDRAGRIRVRPDLTIPGHPEIFVVGDMAALGLPGVAQVAMQGGRYAAGIIAGRLAGRPQASPFRYFDKGTMATIGRFSAVANVGKLHFSGLLGWLMCSECTCST